MVCDSGGILYSVCELLAHSVIDIQAFDCAIHNVLTAKDQMKLMLLNQQICLYEITPLA